MSQVHHESPVAASGKDQAHFVVGQDPRGQWLAIETHHLGGGLFKSRQHALRFVGFETDHRPGAVEIATRPLQLTF